MNFLALFTAAAVALTPTAMAEESSAEEAVKGRQAIMKYIGGNMRPLAGMARGQIEFNAGQVQAVGKAVSAMTLAYINLFPEGSENVAETAAAPAIFSDRAGFVAAAMKLKAASDGLALANDAEALGTAFKNMAGACSACHDTYRLKKN